MLIPTNRSIRWMSRLALGLFVASLFFTTAGCALSQKPRDHWWQLWRKTPTEQISPTDPDFEILPPPPSAVQTGEGLSGQDDALPPEVTELPEPPTAEEPPVMEEPEPIRQEPAGSISQMQTVNFAYDSAELTPEAKRKLDLNAQWLLDNPGYQIQIQGHCDERGTVEYNLNLGDRRAKSVKAYLISKGVAPDRLHTISYGEERPIDPSHVPEAWAQNRRVEFLVY